MAIEPSLSSKYSTALVTGAAAGIGRAVSEKLVEQGIGVVCVDRDTDTLTRLGKDLGALAYPVTMDLDDSESVQQALQSLPKDRCAVDILVNNAGHAIGGQRSFEKGSLFDWERIAEYLI